MRNRLIVTFLWFFMVSLSCVGTPEAATAALGQEIVLTAANTTGTPAVEIPENHFDFGEMTDGNDYVHAFLIRNMGAGVLEINQIHPD